MTTGIRRHTGEASAAERVTFAQGLKMRGQWRQPKPPTQAPRAPDGTSDAR